MNTTLNVENLSLKDVYRLLGLQEQPMGAYGDFLSFEPLSDYEQQELAQIATDFNRYLFSGKVSEGLVKALTVYPLLRLAGFYRFPVELHLEEAIERITVDDDGVLITGGLIFWQLTRKRNLAGNHFGC